MQKWFNSTYITQKLVPPKLGRTISAPNCCCSQSVNCFIRTKNYSQEQSMKLLSTRTQSCYTFHCTSLLGRFCVLPRHAQLFCNFSSKLQ